MGVRVRRCTAGLAFAAAVCGCGTKPAKPPAGGPPAVAPDVQARRDRFVRRTISADETQLADGDRKAVAHLVRAAALVDAIFQRQAWQGYPELAPQVQALAGPDVAAAKEYFAIMMGPWDRLRGFEPFIGSAPHPAGAGLYPEDVTAGELERWLATHPADRKALTSPVTVIRRSGADLVAVPYAREYRDLLEPAAAELDAAARTVTSPTLRTFLSQRARAFVTDDYFESDAAWMDVDSPLEVAIGPYETYEDGLLGAKAAFEAFVCVARAADSAQLARYRSELPYLERRLPIPDDRKSTLRGSESPILVADEIVTGGDARCGVQTLAFNLPNDERVRAAKGSKKVLLRNVMQAKYDAVLTPVAARTLVPGEAGNVSFNSYFHHVLFHELAHGLGPGRISADGRATEVRAELRELYGPIEEAKADVLGVWALAVLQNRELVAPDILEPLPWTYLAGLLRAARFGASDAHGLAAVIEFNHLLEGGAIEVTKDGRFRPVLPMFAAGVKALAHDLLMVEADGSHEAARALVKKYGTAPPALAKALRALDDVPVDIEPVFAAVGVAPRGD